MVQRSAMMPGADETSQDAILKTLADIVTGRRIRRKHTGKILNGKDLSRLSLPRTKRSLEAVRFLGNHGHCDNLVTLVTLGHVTVDDLKKFLDRTRLAETNRGRIENALRKLGRIAEVKAAEAARFSSGGDTTGELNEMLNTAGPLTAAVPAGTGHRRFTKSRQ